MPAWRPCYASATLLDEIDDRWPGRSKKSDGTKGDDKHAARKSEHNPDKNGIVRARDITALGIDAPYLAEYLRKLGATGDPRLRGGFVIFNGRITTPDFKKWKPYTGSNPHKLHIHVSFSPDVKGYDSLAPWGIYPGPRTVVPKTLPTIRYGERSGAVLALQKFLVKTFPGYAQFEPTGFYGDQTKAAVKEFQRRAGVYGAPLDGSICGAATNYALARYGYRG